VAVSLFLLKDIMLGQPIRNGWFIVDEVQKSEKQKNS